jgi:hypothetical protein
VNNEIKYYTIYMHNSEIELKCTHTDFKYFSPYRSYLKIVCFVFYCLFYYYFFSFLIFHCLLHQKECGDNIFLFFKTGISMKKRRYLLWIYLFLLLSSKKVSFFYLIYFSSTYQYDLLYVLSIFYYLHDISLKRILKTH